MFIMIRVCSTHTHIPQIPSPVTLYVMRVCVGREDILTLTFHHFYFVPSLFVYPDI